MLLLIVLTAGLASGAAQSISPAPFSSFTSGTPTAETPDSVLTNNIVVILQTTVQSNRELNETTVAPILTELYEIIQQGQPDRNFTLTVKNITKV
ncbi:unnamed protein product [Pleuronectes platessa]|uniref:Uncharacterized protein n=1 Tax=Pleuronectes platessa TaxID=8262 RepID=A0A9N7V789_PLEPL|nr:unnamed protein product [Pleuronectes platessa]